MTSQYDPFVALFKADASYRAWFKRWWAEDFSLSGRKQQLQRNGYAARHVFAGKSWVVGWAPPHDLDGTPNPSFVWLDERAVRQPLWESIRSDLAGSFIEGGGPGFLSNSAANLNFCCVAKDIVIDPPTNKLNISDGFFAGSLVLQLQRQVELNLSRTLVTQRLSATSSRPVRYDMSSCWCEETPTSRARPQTGLLTVPELWAL